jgi:hypothetical protein
VDASAHLMALATAPQHQRRAGKQYGAAGASDRSPTRAAAAEPMPARGSATDRLSGPGRQQPCALSIQIQRRQVDVVGTRWSGDTASGEWKRQALPAMIEVSERIVMDLQLRPGSPQDANACGAICFAAFTAIAEQHNFPPDWPSPEVTTAFMSAFLAGRTSIPSLPLSTAALSAVIS